MHEHEYEEHTPQQLLEAERQAPTPGAHAALVARMAPGGNRAVAGALQRKQAPGKAEDAGVSRGELDGRERIAQLCGNVHDGALDGVRGFCEEAKKEPEPTWEEDAARAAIVAAVMFGFEAVGVALLARVGLSVVAGAIVPKAGEAAAKAAAAAGKEAKGGAASKLVKGALDKGKESGKKEVETLVKAGLAPGKAAVTLESFRALQLQAIDEQWLGFSGNLNATLGQLPAQEREPVLAAVGAALAGMREVARRKQQAATADAWFGAQRTPAATTWKYLPGKNPGEVAITLKPGAAPDAATKMEAGWLAGEGANAGTMAMYKDRPLEEIRLQKVIDFTGTYGASMFGDAVPCNFGFVVSETGEVKELRRLSASARYWLAAKAIGRAHFPDGPAPTDAQVLEGARRVYEEIKGRSVAKDGGEFGVNSNWNWDSGGGGSAAKPYVVAPKAGKP